MKLHRAWRGLLLAGGAYLAKRWWQNRQAGNRMGQEMGAGSGAGASGGAGYASGGGMGSDPASGSPPGL